MSDRHVSEHLANERTYLAWLRTSFSLLTLGFATNKFAQFIIELRLKSQGDVPARFLYGSRRFGLWMVVMGTVLMIISNWIYQRNRRKIDSGDFTPSSGVIWIVGIMAVSFGVTAIVLLMQS